MPLVKSKLKEQIQAALEIGKNAPKDSNPDSVLNETAQKLADAIDNYITSGTVTSTINSGTIATAGGPTNQLGPAVQVKITGDIT